ncbi:MAG: hypothetical protein KGL99_04445 [Burkholderiales bacterium]|nr:hypothetical protein [Burkholderiales bacterium]
MTLLRPTGRLRRAACGLAIVLPFGLGAAPLRAQTLYEWREPGGTMVYSQFPPEPGEASGTRALVLHDLDGVERATALRVAVQSLPPADPAQRALARADARIGVALAHLQRAEKNLRTGQKPGPGERRRHRVDGHVWLTRGYFDRISALEASVGRDRAELQAAYAARDALMP